MQRVLDSVREFGSFADLLKADYQKRSLLSRPLSIRRYGQMLEIDASTISQTMRKQRRLSGRLVQNIGRKLGLSNADLSVLVDREIDSDSVIVPTTEPAMLKINDWRYDALLEILDGKAESFDLSTLAAPFQSSVDELKAMMARMIKAGFLALKDGVWSDDMKHVTTIINPIDSDQDSRDYQKSLLDQSKRSIETVPTIARNHTSIMLKIDPSDLPAILGVLKTTRRSLAKEFQKAEPSGIGDVSEAPERVLYALQIALFPLVPAVENDNV